MESSLVALSSLPPHSLLPLFSEISDKSNEALPHLRSYLFDEIKCEIIFILNARSSFEFFVGENEKDLISFVVLIGDDHGHYVPSPPMNLEKVLKPSVILPLIDKVIDSGLASKALPGTVSIKMASHPPILRFENQIKHPDLADFPQLPCKRIFQRNGILDHFYSPTEKR